MTMSRTEAQEALSEIERTTGRSFTLRAYRGGGPILMLWGVIWIIGYVAMGLEPPDRWGLVWAPLDLIGFVATLLMVCSRHPGADRVQRAWRTVGMVLAVGAFCGAVLTIFQGRGVNTYLAFPGLITGMIYAMIGVWRMPRYVWIGAAMFAATLAGYFWFPMWLAFWMAGVGGCALILGGFWLRRA